MKKYQLTVLAVSAQRCELKAAVINQFLGEITKKNEKKRKAKTFH